MSASEAFTTDRQRYEHDPCRRWPTQHRGISYRLTRSLERRYVVYFEGKFVQVEGGLVEARAKQGELQQAKSRGEKPVLSTKLTFGELACEWWESKEPRLRHKTVTGYRSALDLVLLPRFGTWRLSAIDTDAIVKLIRDLEREGLHTVDRSRPVRPLGRSSVENYLLPLRLIVKLALRRRLISVDPFSLMLDEDRPKPAEQTRPHEWTEADVQALLIAAERLAGKPEARCDYSRLLKLMATTGIRVGEALGLQWRDLDVHGSTLSIVRQWTPNGEYAAPKTRAGMRQIAIPGDLRAMLLDLRLSEQRKGRGRDLDPIFCSRAGTPMQYRNVASRGFEPARDAAELPKDLTLHSLRHASVSRLIAKGVSVEAVSQYHGHSNSRVTLTTYSHLFDRQESDRAIREALEGVAA